MSLSTINAYDVANVFTKLSDTDSGDILTNLKLQKLVYYVQGFHLAIYNEPLYVDDLVAWEHGPVVVDLYHKLKDSKSGQITIESPVSKLINEKQLALIGEINNVYGQFSAWKLRDMTHNESPWQTTEKNQVITHEKLKAYFKKQLQ
jgi:uncharacterized phage-associated protein